LNEKKGRQQYIRDPLAPEACGSLLFSGPSPVCVKRLR
jgi:hypothetical protein